MPTVLEPGTHSITLTGAGKSIPIWIEDGIEGISEMANYSQSIFSAGGGPGKHGDYEAGFSFAEQRTWEGGRALEFFTDDQTRYLDSKGAWTLTPGKAAPAPQWFYGVGYRPNLSQFVLPGNVTWRPLYGENTHVDRKVTMSATITADKVYVWIRRIGDPQNNLTLRLRSDDGSGSPDTVLKTTTVNTDDIDDHLSVLQVFDHATTQSLTSGTAYHIEVYGDSADDRDNHWEIATDADVEDGLVSEDGSTWTATTYSIYYRIVGADVKAYHLPFVLDQQLYFVSVYSDGTASRIWMNGKRGIATAGAATTITDSANTFGTASEFVNAKVKIIRGTGAGQVRTIVSHTNTVLTVATWDVNPDATSQYIIYQTARFVEVGTTGLATVTDVATYNNLAYFAQGEATNIRQMRYDPATPGHAFQDDGTNKATLLEAAYLSTGPNGVIWRANNDATAAGANTVSRANMVAWGSDHTFGTAIKAGNGDYPITNILEHSSGTSARLAVFKTGENGFIDTDKWYRENINIASFVERTNGVAAKIHGLYKVFNWSNSVERQYGEAVDDIDPNREAGLPAGRQGYISCVETHPVGLLFGIDAGDDGTSSVLFFDGFNYHEIFRAPEMGKRIRSLVWQPNEEGKKYLWVGCGDDLIYLEFPRWTRNPLEDPTQKFMHEFSIVSATFDLGNSSIYKVWKDIAFVTKNLDGSHIKIVLDYQTDTDIDTDTWTKIDAAEIRTSPSDVAKIMVGEAQQLRYRIRCYTNDATVPPIINGITVKARGQLPFSSNDTFWGTFGPVATEVGGSSEDALDLFTEGERRSRVWEVSECVYSRAIGKLCTVSVLQIDPAYSTDNRDNVRAQLQLIGLD